MSRLQFSFLPENLKATANYLVAAAHFPTAKRTPEEMETRLKNAAIKSFSEKYRKVQSVKGRPLEHEDIEEDVVEAPVLWRGIGVLFCPVPSGAVDGATTLTIDMPFEVEPKFIIGASFLVVLR